VGAFDPARSDGQSLVDGAGTVELVQPVVQVAPALTHRRIVVGRIDRLEVALQGAQHGVEPALDLEPALLFVQPVPLGTWLVLDGLGRSREVVAHMVEVHQVAALAAEALLDLLGDPRRAVAQSVHAVAGGEAGALGAGTQLLARGGDIARRAWRRRTAAGCRARGPS
jgi:hypothetical protein